MPCGHDLGRPLAIGEKSGPESLSVAGLADERHEELQDEATDRRVLLLNGDDEGCLSLPRVYMREYVSVVVLGRTREGDAAKKEKKKRTHADSSTPTPTCPPSSRASRAPSPRACALERRAHLPPQPRRRGNRAPPDCSFASGPPPEPALQQCPRGVPTRAPPA